MLNQPQADKSDRYVREPRPVWLDETDPLQLWDCSEIWHLDGIPWHDAPIPRRFHKCWPQTTGWVMFNETQRCACGAIRRNSGSRRWRQRNQRRR